jgi:hypothetical protein
MTISLGRRRVLRCPPKRLSSPLCSLPRWVSWRLPRGGLSESSATFAGHVRAPRDGSPLGARRTLSVGCSQFAGAPIRVRRASCTGSASWQWLWRGCRDAPRRPRSLSRQRRVRARSISASATQLAKISRSTSSRSSSAWPSGTSSRSQSSRGSAFEPGVPSSSLHATCYWPGTVGTPPRYQSSRAARASAMQKTHTTSQARTATDMPTAVTDLPPRGVSTEDLSCTHSRQHFGWRGEGP